ncbi:MAG: hypothetical protein ABI036_15090 [Fibrobacteria bacterium]
MEKFTIVNGNQKRKIELNTGLQAQAGKKKDAWLIALGSLESHVGLSRVDYGTVKIQSNEWRQER